MVIAIASAVPRRRPRGAHRARVAWAPVGPTVLRARDAEAWSADRIDWAAGAVPDDADVAAEFGPALRRRGPPDRRPPLDRRLPPPRRRRAGRPPAANGRSRERRRHEPALPAARQRRRARRRRRLARREPALRAARAPRAARRQGRVRAGRVRLVLVLVDGTLVCSCLVLAASAVGREITTVEGLGPDGALTDVQQAFLDEGAVQCGFCTPGLDRGRARPARRQPAPERPRGARGAVAATSAAAPATAASSPRCRPPPSAGVGA